MAKIKDARRVTCAGCQHLDITDMMGGRLGVCKARSKGEGGAVVPQHTDHSTVTFWRVPLECPLSDKVVKKSANKAPFKDWVTERPRP